MVFSSVEFLFVFFPVALIGYFLMPKMLPKNIWLLIVSLVFYAYGEPVYLLLLLASCLMNYVFGRLAASPKPWRKLVLAAAVVLNLGLLAVFKYSAFFTETINGAFHLAIPVPQLTFPIGISFYTFQAMSYVIDVYRDPSTSQRNFYKLLLYILLFPQLIAGPIVKYHDVAAQIDHRTQTLPGVARGLRRFMLGLGKKVLLANTLGLAVDTIYALAPSELSAPAAWLGAIAYALQIYYDFSGYSDMAIGISGTFGFQLKENFDHPYYADSIQNFWRRWHISLSTWFKEYLYIPLGGNRRGQARTILNKVIVFFCTGLWHGANWTFIVWGLYHGLFQLLEQAKIVPIGKIKWRPVRQLYACLVVIGGFVIFRADTLSQAGQMFKQMVTGFVMTPEQITAFCPIVVPSLVIVLIVGAVFAMPILPKVKERFEGRPVAVVLSYVATFAVFALCVLRLSAGAYNPFIYFRF
ncbi:MAG: MBOAT family protein [Clostridia bacterium]|nr:MBOAT family protein [Clostridia bacterium]